VLERWRGCVSSTTSNARDNFEVLERWRGSVSFVNSNVDDNVEVLERWRGWVSLATSNASDNLEVLDEDIEKIQYHRHNKITAKTNNLLQMRE